MVSLYDSLFEQLYMRAGGTDGLPLTYELFFFNYSSNTFCPVNGNKESLYSLDTEIP